MKLNDFKVVLDKETSEPVLDLQLSIPISIIDKTEDLRYETHEIIEMLGAELFNIFEELKQRLK